MFSACLLQGQRSGYASSFLKALGKDDLSLVNLDDERTPVYESDLEHTRFSNEFWNVCTSERILRHAQLLHRSAAQRTGMQARELPISGVHNNQQELFSGYV
jgi:hypothetical protein